MRMVISLFLHSSSFLQTKQCSRNQSVRPVDRGNQKWSKEERNIASLAIFVSSTFHPHTQTKTNCDAQSNLLTDQISKEDKVTRTMIFK